MQSDIPQEITAEKAHPEITAEKAHPEITAEKICGYIPVRRFPNFGGYLYVVKDTPDENNHYKQYAYFNFMPGRDPINVRFESKLDISWYIGIICKSGYIYGHRETNDELFRVNLMTGKITYHMSGKWVFIGNDAYINNPDNNAIYDLNGKKYAIEFNKIVKWNISKDYRGYLITMMQHEKPCDANKWSSPYSYIIYSYPEFKKIYEGSIPADNKLSQKELVDIINIYEGVIEIHGAFIKINGFNETRTVHNLDMLD